MQTQSTLNASNLICTEADAIIFKEIEGSVIRTFQNVSTFFHLLFSSLHFFIFFFFLHFHNSLCQLSLLSRLSPAISLQPISLERERQRRALQSARELQTNNMHLSLCIPNSDSRRLLAKRNSLRTVTSQA